MRQKYFLSYLTLMFIIISLVPATLAGQDDALQFLFLDDWSYELLEYWLNTGDFQHPFVLNQPYTIQDIESGLNVKNAWQRLLAQHYRAHYGEVGVGKVLLYGRDQVSLVSDSNMPIRKSPMAAPLQDVLLFDNRTKNHYNVAAEVNLALPHFSLVNRTVVNSELKDDPRYFGDTGEWIYGRINDSYMNVNSGPFDFFIGRMSRNWGALSSAGLVLSDNPYSYDHVQLSYASRRFKFSMIVSRLEDLEAVVVENPDSTFDARKFVTAHRFDFSFSNRLQLALTEVAVYGGPDRDFELSFLNPMNYFYIVQRNNRQQVNGIWAVDLFYKPKPGLNLFAQLLVDDFIINNSAEGDDRENFPDRLGVTLKLTEADHFSKGLQTGIEYTRIGNRTYQSRRTYENFHYREKSMGYPFSSTESVAFSAKYFNLYPFMLSFKGGFRRVGDVDITDVFPLRKEEFPVGTVEKSWSTEMKAQYFVNYWSRLTATVGYENIENFNNVDGDNRSNFKFILGAHLNLEFSHRFK